MPRATRARRVAAQSAKPHARSPSPDTQDDQDNRPQQKDKSPERGRRRATRSSGARVSTANKEDVLAANRRRDAALDKLGREDPTSTTSRTAEEVDSGSSVEGGRRTAATPMHRRDTSGLDLADSVFLDLDESFGLGDDSTQLGLGSNNNSSLNLSNFGRRSRQSSIIGRSDPPIRPSSRGGNTPSISSTLHFGAFKRRAREPSILGTARKPRPEENAVGQELDSDSESEDDFAPEAESTPVNNRRRTQPEVELEIEVPASPDVSAGPKHRKRKSEDALPSSERPEKMSRIERDAELSEDEAGPAPEAIDSDAESDSSLSDLGSPLGPSPVLPERPITPIDNDELMALPASSDSEDANWPDIHTLAKRRRRPSITTPVRADNFSDVSSPPSLTHSPNFADTQKPRGRAATRRQQPPPKVTTADLTSLLPKRHYKKQREPGMESDEEHDTSGIGEDEDELSYVSGRGARQRRGGRSTSRGGAKRPGSRGGRTTQALKPKQTDSGKQAARNAQTYSRRSSDKENENEEASGEEDEHDNSRFQPLPDDTFEDGSAENASTPSADELRQAAKKFKEVDRWELDFEEVTQSSSPLAR
ncbi:hypothetical protein FSPOR_11531 [Fusarium sporotrichioides]|uniref:Uncharacterized protein n=1 Tax=Fusarium sporotrichioides TaxID=5514 RepID=A0A395RGC0_FUSSP|nr:hypothetical protein FSPOR_11531 [Fusarium sporotrichioides]